jgi:hypothetical protein
MPRSRGTPYAHGTTCQASILPARRNLARRARRLANCEAGLGLGGRKTQRDRRALADRAFYRDPSAVLFDHGFDEHHS